MKTATWKPSFPAVTSTSYTFTRRAKPKRTMLNMRMGSTQLLMAARNTSKPVWPTRSVRKDRTSPASRASATASAMSLRPTLAGACGWATFSAAAVASASGGFTAGARRGHGLEHHALR